MVDLHVLRAAEERHSERSSSQESNDIGGLGNRNVDSDGGLKMQIDARRVVSASQDYVNSSEFIVSSLFVRVRYNIQRLLMPTSLT
jgi:hypothetical protein